MGRQQINIKYQNYKSNFKEEVTRFLKELEEFGNIFASSILTLKGKR
ncbi:MAG: hypothetical protein AB1422_07180 [bacterium]